MKESV